MCLLEFISEKAMSSFNFPRIDEESVRYVYYCKHWFDTAEKIRQDMIKENRLDAATEIKKIVEEEMRFISSKDKLIIEG